MNRIRLIAFSILLLSVPFIENIYGQTQSNSFGSPANITIRKKAKSLSNRPKAPSMQQIFCYYEDGELTFDFAIPEGDCALTVTDLTTNFARNYSFSSEAEATVYVGTLTEAYIEISTESGHEYEGYLGQNDY